MNRIINENKGISKLCNFLVEFQLQYVAKKIKHDLNFRNYDVNKIQHETLKIKQEIKALFELQEKYGINISENIEEASYGQCFNKND